MLVSITVIFQVSRHQQNHECDNSSSYGYFERATVTCIIFTQTDPDSNLNSTTVPLDWGTHIVHLKSSCSIIITWGTHHDAMYHISTLNGFLHGFRESGVLFFLSSDFYFYEWITSSESGAPATWPSC